MVDASGTLCYFSHCNLWNSSPCLSMNSWLQISQVTPLIVTIVGILTSTFFPRCSTNFFSPFQEPRVSCFLFFTQVSINYKLLWCCLFIPNCYHKIRIQCKHTYWEDNALSSQYLYLYLNRKKHYFLKNRLFLFLRILFIRMTRLKIAYSTVNRRKKYQKLCIILKKHRNFT